MPRVGVDHHAVDDVELDRRPAVRGVVEDRRQKAQAAEGADDIDAGAGP